MGRRAGGRCNSSPARQQRPPAAGAEVRTLDEFFNRLIVVDRRVALIPGHEGTDSAMVISDSETAESRKQAVLNHIYHHQLRNLG